MSRDDKRQSYLGLGHSRIFLLLSHMQKENSFQVNELHSECKLHSFRNALGPLKGHLGCQGSSSTQDKL